MTECAGRITKNVLAMPPRASRVLIHVRIHRSRCGRVSGCYVLPQIAPMAVYGRVDGQTVEDVTGAGLIDRTGVVEVVVLDHLLAVIEIDLRQKMAVQLEGRKTTILALCIEEHQHLLL